MAKSRRSKLPMLSTIIPNAEPIPLAKVKPVTSWIRVTPELATKWLENSNYNNRKVRDTYVSRLAQGSHRT